MFQSEGGEHSRKNCVCLCTTHHGRLHDGRLRIEGNAEEELAFRDESGAPIGSPAASHGGTSAVAKLGASDEPAASHRGTAAATQVGASDEPAASHRGTAAVAQVGASDEAATLLAVMGQRGGWSVDALVDASGLAVGAVLSGLVCLELDGRVQCDATDSYARSASRG